MKTTTMGNFPISYNLRKYHGLKVYFNELNGFRWFLIVININIIY